MKDETKLAFVCLGTFAFIVLLPFMVLYDAWAASIVARWFLPNLDMTFVQWCGVSLLVALFRADPTQRLKTTKEGKEVLVESLTRAFFRPAFLVGFAWVVKWIVL